MENQQDFIEKVLDSLDQPKTICEIGYQIYLKSRLDKKILPSSDVCKNCLTSFTLGQFKIDKIKPSNHRRKLRRQHKIDSLQKFLKSSSSAGIKTGKELRKLKRQIEHLQDLNNHVMIYKCEICQTLNNVRLWKPKLKPKQSVEFDAGTSEQHEKITPKDMLSGNKTATTKKGKKKKDKTAGLLIPASNTTTTSVATNQHKKFSIAKLLSSSNLQQQQSKAKSKLNQFLK